MRAFGQSDTEESVLISFIMNSVSFIHAEHLNTKSYARHKALDKFYKEMPELIDRYAEAYIANNSNFKYSSSFPWTTAENALTAIIDNINAIYAKQSSELKTLLDDMLVLCQQTKYLLRLQ